MCHYTTLTERTTTTMTTDGGGGTNFALVTLLPRQGLVPAG